MLRYYPSNHYTMYDKEQVRNRFLEEVDRLITGGVAKSNAKLAEGCGLQSYHLSDIRQGRSEVSLMILTSFVQAYRNHGVSYGYILDGEREKPAMPREAMVKLEQAREQLEDAFLLLSNQ